MDTDSPDPLELMALLASGQVGDDVLRWMQSGVNAWIECDGDVSLERCLKLPATPVKMRQMKRNKSLIDAAKVINCTSSWDCAVSLAGELNDFISRGPWRAWRDLKSPPAGTSRLRTALFHVAKFGDAKTLTPMQIWRILQHIFR